MTVIGARRCAGRSRVCRRATRRSRQVGVLLHHVGQLMPKQLAALRRVEPGRRIGDVNAFALGKRLRALLFGQAGAVMNADLAEIVAKQPLKLLRHRLSARLARLRRLFNLVVVLASGRRALALAGAWVAVVLGALAHGLLGLLAGTFAFATITANLRCVWRLLATDVGCRGAGASGLTGSLRFRIHRHGESPAHFEQQFVAIARQPLKRSPWL